MKLFLFAVPATLNTISPALTSPTSTWRPLHVAQQNVLPVRVQESQKGTKDETYLFDLKMNHVSILNLQYFQGLILVMTQELKMS